MADDKVLTGSIVDRLSSMRIEFDEQPGLVLTVGQVEERWGLESAMARVLLEVLVDVGFLRRSSNGAYFRRPDRAIDDV